MTDLVCTKPLLRPGADAALRRAYATYPEPYDDVLNDVRARLAETGAARKLGLAALIAWKHVRNAKWMKVLLTMEAVAVESATQGAFAPDLTDDERIAALRLLPGFGGGGAFTSVLLTAWDPTTFGVYDRLVKAKRSIAVCDSCTCDWSALPTYWAHLRAIAAELGGQGDGSDIAWTPRAVDMALMNLE